MPSLAYKLQTSKVVIIFAILHKFCTNFLFLDEQSLDLLVLLFVNSKTEVVIDLQKANFLKTKLFKTLVLFLYNILVQIKYILAQIK